VGLSGEKNKISKPKKETDAVGSPPHCYGERPYSALNGILRREGAGRKGREIAGVFRNRNLGEVCERKKRDISVVSKGGKSFPGGRPR